jgi:diguanylate cyclase (GGDEF)-like protein
VTVAAERKTLLDRTAFPWERLFERQFLVSNFRRVFDGDPLAFVTEPLDPALAARVRAEQLSAIVRNTPMMMLGAGLNAFVFAFVMRESPSAPSAYLWTAALLSLASFMFVRRVRAPSTAPKRASVRGTRRAVYYALLHGSLWSAVPGVFFMGASSPQQLVIVCLVIGMLCSGAFTLAPIPLATVAYVGPIVAGSTRAIMGSGDPIYYVVAALMVVYTTVLVGGVVSHAFALARRCVVEAEIEAGALIDPLTRLPNRAAFRVKMTETLERRRRLGEVFALMSFDLDRLKVLNDDLGHSAGDRTLFEAARRLRSAAPEEDMVAHLGGDEFALIATGAASVEQAKAIAERIVDIFRHPFQIEGRSWPLTISFGVAFAPADGEEIDTLLRNANVALYSTKQTRRGSYAFFSDHFAEVVEREKLDAELRRAIANRELYLVFQPFVEIATLLVTGFEALLRWRHPTRGSLSAGHIVPLLEETGLIGEVGAFIIREAVTTAASWPPHLRLAINVSPIQLRRSTELEATIRGVIAATGFDPSRLELEITESAIIADREQAVLALRSLRSLGLEIALDDFGTGHSSLSNVVELPLDRLKIDRSFISNMETDAACASVVELTLGLARPLGLKVTAEGVETREQYERLRELGDLELQGYLFSEPKSASEIDSVLAQPFVAKLGGAADFLAS